MNKFGAIMEVVKAVVTFGLSMRVILLPCKCGSAEVKPQRNRDRNWYVFCNSCRLRTPAYRWKRTAKEAWNEQLGDKGCG